MRKGREPAQSVSVQCPAFFILSVILCVLQNNKKMYVKRRRAPKRKKETKEKEIVSNTMCNLQVTGISK